MTKRNGRRVYHGSFSSSSSSSSFSVSSSSFSPSSKQGAPQTVGNELDAAEQAAMETCCDVMMVPRSILVEPVVTGNDSDSIMDVEAPWDHGMDNEDYEATRYLKSVVSASSPFDHAHGPHHTEDRVPHSPDDDDDDSDMESTMSHATTASERLRCAQDFWKARTLRRQTYGRVVSAYGIYGLFQHVVELKVDWKWAHAVASHRRKPKERQGAVAMRQGAEKSKGPANSGAAANTDLSWSDYERTHRERQRTPTFTILLLVLCSAAMVASMALNDWKFADLRANPMLGPSPQVLIRMGALDVIRIVVHGEWYRVVTAIILHAGLIHYVINMVALWVLGRTVERVYGTVATAVLFMVPAVGGNIASALLLATSYSISVGASGGLFALLGICLAEIFANWDLITLRDPHSGEAELSTCRIVYWLILELMVSMVIGLTPYVDNCIHLGGFMYALGMGLPFLDQCSGSRLIGTENYPNRRTRYWLCRIAVFSITSGLFLGTASLLWTQQDRLSDTGQPTPLCEPCRYMSCVPFPFWKESDKWWHCDGCDHVAAELFYHGETMTEVVIDCPFHGAAVVELQGLKEQRAVLRELPALCRSNCHD